MMDVGSLIVVGGTVIFIFGCIVCGIMDCIEHRQQEEQHRQQQRHEENMAVRAAMAARAVGVAENVSMTARAVGVVENVAAAAGGDNMAWIALAVLEFVSLPRQHLDNADGSTKTMAAERPECVFCLGELEDAEEWVVLKRCHHEFHRKCLVKWLEQKKSNCPICRAMVWPGALPKTPALADMV
jgi:hypothetical protein